MMIKENIVGVVAQKCEECGCYHIQVCTTQGMYIKDITDEGEAVHEVKNLTYQSTLFHQNRLN